MRLALALAFASVACNAITGVGDLTVEDVSDAGLGDAKASIDRDSALPRADGGAVVEAGTFDADAAVAKDADATTAMPTSCKQLHAIAPNLPSGTYPFGSTTAYCDMTTAGGGWTLVFEPPLDQNSETLTWTSTGGSVQSASEVLMVYRKADRSTVGTTAVFPLLEAWKAMPPLQAQGSDAPVSVSLNGAAPVTKTLRYGYANFPALCSDDWDTSTSFGRICIVDSTAPFYNGFANAEADHCPDSNSDYAAADCAASLEFTIAVR